MLLSPWAEGFIGHPKHYGFGSTKRFWDPASGMVPAPNITPLCLGPAPNITPLCLVPAQSMKSSMRPLCLVNMVNLMKSAVSHRALVRYGPCTKRDTALFGQLTKEWFGAAGLGARRREKVKFAVLLRNTGQGARAGAFASVAPHLQHSGGRRWAGRPGRRRRRAGGAAVGDE
jgi:hypothetical protein